MSEYHSGLAPELARGGEKISAKILKKTRAAKPPRRGKGVSQLGH
jgi:hypothetical protein